MHLEEQDGWREYRFRSVDRNPLQRLPARLHGAMAAAVLQDQVSSLFPAAPLLVPPLLAAAGILHVKPELYVMADDPRLGEHRDPFAGMLGTVELRPEEGPGTSRDSRARAR